MTSRPHWRRWQAIGRAGVAALLALAALNPNIAPRKPPADVIVLLDASDSLPAGENTWPAIASRLAALPAGSRWALVRYGAEPVLEQDWSGTAALSAHSEAPARAPVDGTSSRLDRALAAALEMASAQRPTALLMVTDGGGAGPEVEGLLAGARDATIPVHVMPVPVDGGGPRIDAVTTPPLVGAGVPAEVRVALTGPIPDDASVSLKLDGLTVARRATGAGAAGMQRLTIGTPPAGVHRLEATLRARDGTVLDRADSALHAAGATPVLLVGDKDSPVGDLLEGAGLDVTRTSPSRLSSLLGPSTVDNPRAATTPTSRYGLIVLDDINAGRLDASTMTRLAATVHRQGAGLLALGGRRSFGAGAYRHSALEDLLPVIAEAREPLPPAAILFVVDTSGSMARSERGPTRLAMARRAVLDTALSLASTDAVGLISFDVAPTLVLPVTQRLDPAAALEAGWPVGAGGGTHAAPAVELATQILTAAAPDLRLLILVTDGFVEETFDASLIESLRGGGIDVIAMPVGNDAPSAPLASLTAVNAGRLLPVADSAVLPSLMQTEVAARRPVAVHEAGLAVIADGQGWVPGAGVGSWPAVDGYMVTRARAGARVLLRAPAGEPLLAAMPAGAGFTAAMPAGLGPTWAGGWQTWDGLGGFLTDLAGWLAGQPSQANLYMRFDDSSSSPRIHVDVLGQDGQWRNDATPTLSVRTPGGHTAVLDLSLTGPGAYEALLPSAREGLYVATARSDGLSLVRGHVHRPVGEHADARSGAERIAAWLSAGLVRGTTPWRFSRPAGSAAAGVRHALLMAALLLYVAVLIVERRAALFRRERAGRTRNNPTVRVAEPIAEDIR